MKHAVQTASPFWISCLIGLPIAAITLVATSGELRSRFDDVASLWSRLDAPYRYGLFESAERLGNPIARIEQEIALYQARLRQDPTSPLNASSLAIAYLQMAKVTGEGNWYLLSEQAARQSLANLPNNTEALMVLARVAEARHDFAQALKLAAQVPDSKDSLGIQVTANLATGKLEAASQAADQLVDRLPSISSLTLRALVKTVQGNDAAALQNFQDAIASEEAGELTSSARTRSLLGRFHYERGNLEQAAALYQEALRIQPDYPLALINLAQLEIRQGHYASADRHYAAIAATSRGTARVFDPLILRGQARIKQLQGDTVSAQALWSEAEALLRQTVAGAAEQNTAAFGHRRDLARLMLERGTASDIREAVALMQSEVKVRQDGETLGTYAWALFKAGQPQAALPVSQAAIATGIRDASLYDQASAIEQALGRSAQTTAQKALEIDPQFGTGTRNALHLAAGLGG